MNKEEARKIMEEARKRSEEKEKEAQFTGSIIFGLALILGFYAAYGFVRPDSFSSFIVYIFISIIMSIGMLFPLSFIIR